MVIATPAPPPPSPSRAARLLIVAAPVAVGIIAAALGIWRLMPGVGYWDTAEFQTIPPLLGTAHPTGYPTLTLLEDMGYARVSVEEGGKKIYSITDEGRAYLAQNRSAVDDIFDRIAELGSTFLSDAVMDVNRAIKDVAQAAYRGAPRVFRDKEAVTKIRDILDRASKEIEEIVRESRERSQA